MFPFKLVFSDAIISKVFLHFRSLYRWLERLKKELPYYDECNAHGVEVFKNWAKARKTI